MKSDSSILICLDLLQFPLTLFHHLLTIVSNLFLWFPLHQLPLSVANSTSGEHSISSKSATDASAIPIDHSVAVENHNSDSRLPSNSGTTSCNGDPSVDTIGHSTDISVPNVSNTASVDHSESNTLVHPSLPTTSTNTHPM